jgi:hypothetical protein
MRPAAAGCSASAGAAIDTTARTPAKNPVFIAEPPVSKILRFLGGRTLHRMTLFANADSLLAMSTRAPEPPSIVVRAAVWVGDAFGRWQRSRAAARDDSFVQKWKIAWNEGCEACKAGKPLADVPYSRSPRKDAWLAGWRWAERETTGAANGST